MQFVQKGSHLCTRGSKVFEARRLGQVKTMDIDFQARRGHVFNKAYLLRPVLNTNPGGHQWSTGETQPLNPKLGPKPSVADTNRPSTRNNSEVQRIEAAGGGSAKCSTLRFGGLRYGFDLGALIVMMGFGIYFAMHIRTIRATIPWLSGPGRLDMLRVRGIPGMFMGLGFEAAWGIG